MIGAGTVNTSSSGKFAARLDDVLILIPAMPGPSDFGCALPA